ncbi:hypothetical protein V8F20_005558 [Naviculisporaceae sp. PSN 640]
MVLGRGFKPFPLPMALGSDICQISRIQKILNRGPNVAGRFVERLMTEEEIRDIRRPDIKQWIDYAISKINRSPNKETHKNIILDENVRDVYSYQRKSGASRTAAYLAGRWAVKEAVIKAHPHRRLNFRDIIVYSTVRQLARHGKERETEADQQGNDMDNSGKESESEGDVAADIVADTRWTGRPSAIVRGRKELGEEDTEVLVSISHDGDYASATCLAWTAPADIDATSSP